MRLLRNRCGGHVEVSVVLLDWSVRESAHMLDYLAEQTVPRGRYEIVWIEYYDRQWDQIRRRNGERAARGLPPAVDTWIIMDIPRDVYYHKHLMYNIGIAAASGRIIVVCDSDSMVRPTFIESIIRCFEEDPNIVLHLDQVRNHSDRFYPFNYPEFDEVIGEGAVNWTGETTTGLADTEDVLHTRNYGGCMAALRADLIAIGGADEHIDFLGYVCGPYDMTFRLVNAGKREMWHRTELLYHTWHPGQTGDCNYAGPHDGKHMSSTALSTRVTARVLPLVENRAVKRLRAGLTLTDEQLLREAFRPEYLRQWKIDVLNRATKVYDIGGNRQVRMHDVRRSRGDGPAYAPTYRPYRCRAGTQVRLYALLYSIGCVKLARAVAAKLARRGNPPGRGPAGLLRKMRDPFGFVSDRPGAGPQIVLRCWQCLCRCAGLGMGEVNLYETGEIAKVITVLCDSLPVRVKAVCPANGRAAKALPGWRMISEAALARDSTPVIVASLRHADRLRERLLGLGVEPQRILMLP